MGRRLEGDFRPARYRFRKVLGFGGAGAAFLFEMRDGDGVALPVVVKASMSVGRRDMQKEKENFVVSASVPFLFPSSSQGGQVCLRVRGI